MENRSSEPRFPFVLFDLGGTLIYFDGEWPVVMAKALQVATRSLRASGYQVDEQAFPQAYQAVIEEFSQKRSDEFVEYTSEHVLRAALSAHAVPEPTPAHLSYALKEMYAVSQGHWQVEADAAAMLETLRAAGCRLGIVSNASDDEDVQTLVDQARIRPYFDFILTSAVAGYRKPSPHIFRQALAFWGARPEECVMIGDTLTADVEGANGMGIASVWITRRAASDDLEADRVLYKPTYTIVALSDLPTILL